MHFETSQLKTKQGEQMSDLVQAADPNSKTAFKVEDFMVCTQSDTELMELILETKQIMEGMFERADRNYRTNTWDEMESV